MTIFRRHSRSLSDSMPVLEASPSDRSLWLGDFHNKSNSVVVKDVPHPYSHDDDDDVSSTSTNYSNASSTHSCDVEEALAQAFTDFEVKHDGPSQENVCVELDIPSNIPVDDLNVQVQGGILCVTGEVTHSASSSSGLDLQTAEEEQSDEFTTTRVEQAFQVDEQSLDLNKMTANLSDDGVLTITAPKKEDEEILDSVPIWRQPPPLQSRRAFWLILDVPGVRPDDLHVHYANSKLRVSANRHFGRARAFKRMFHVDTQKYDASELKTYLYNGRLTVIVPPKKESGVTRQIPIATSGSSRSLLLGTLSETSSESDANSLSLNDDQNTKN